MKHIYRSLLFTLSLIPFCVHAGDDKAVPGLAQPIMLGSVPLACFLMKTVAQMVQEEDVNVLPQESSSFLTPSALSALAIASGFMVSITLNYCYTHLFFEDFYPEYKPIRFKKDK